MNDLSLYVISLSTYLCYLFKKLHSSDFYLDYKYLICQPTSVQMAYSTVTQMQKSQDSSLDQKFQFQACLSFIICSFFFKPSDAEKELADNIESMWLNLFNDSVNVEHALGGIKRMFTEVPLNASPSEYRC